MTEYERITYDILRENKGNYIQLGGKGIIDGLRISPRKFNVLRIGDLRLGQWVKLPTDLYNGVYLMKYRCRIYRTLPEINFDQCCRIYTLKEYRKLPQYS